MASSPTTTPTAPAPAAGTTPGRAPAAAPWPGAVAEWRGVTVWAVVVAAALAWGSLAIDGAGVSLRAAPLGGRWAWHGGPRLAPALVAGGAVAAWGPGVAARAPWRALPWLAGGGAAAWAAALAAADGWARLTEPLTTRHEYEPFAAGVHDLGRFLAGFTDGLPGYPVHVQGHPPGPVVVAWVLDRVGLGGAGWLAALALAGWGIAAGAVLVAARAVAGERAARRAAPALVVVPAAVWAGTSLDALFAGITAASCALAVVAVARWSSARAAGAGVLAGIALLCTYGATAVLVIPVAGAIGPVLTARPSPVAGLPLEPARCGVRGLLGVARLGAWALCGLAAVMGLAAAAGFWWIDGLEATRRAYWTGVGGERPGWYLTLVGNPAALALATGPAVAAGLATGLAAVLAAAWRRLPMTPTPGGLRPGAWRAGVLSAAAMAAVLVADLSQMSRGEVERIWLPFVPWLVLAAPGDRRGWLAAQVAVAAALQSTLVSPW